MSALVQGLKFGVFSDYGDNMIDTSPHNFSLHYHHKLTCQGLFANFAPRLMPLSSTKLGKQTRQARLGRYRGRPIADLCVAR